MKRLNSHRQPLGWLVAVAALSFGLAAGHALAERPGDVQTVKVGFADLDLSKQAGAEALYRRIQAAARSTCGRLDSRELERQRLFRQCYAETMDAAVRQVNQSSLFAVHNGSGAQPEDQEPPAGLSAAARTRQP